MADWQIDWDNKVGEIECKGIQWNIYDSNGLIFGGKIIGYDPQGDMIHSSFTHIINEDHLRNILGLTPGYKNYLAGRWTRITLYKNKCKNWQLIEQTFRESGMDIKIEVVDG